tara:strand:- start:147 stop:518 length:372 start_codon:yes stop_codon:yes gene_type:complete
MKKYLNISEVAKITGLKEHVIRYWDSKDSKTNKLRVEGISRKSSGGTRYFNKDNIKKLQKLKNLIYENGNYNPSLKLANQILNSKKINNSIDNYERIETKFENGKKAEKIDQILKKMRELLRK